MSKGHYLEISTRIISIIWFYKLRWYFFSDKYGNKFKTLNIVELIALSQSDSNIIIAWSEGKVPPKKKSLYFLGFIVLIY